MNRKDRHVVATALAQSADLVVSNDRRLRREINALGGPLRAVTGDKFAQRLLVDQPNGIDAVIDALTARTLLIWGDADGLVGRGMQEQLAAALPCEDLVV